MGTLHGLGQALREVCIAHGVRGDHIHRTTNRRLADTPLHDAQDVVEGDPAHPLPAGGEGGAEPHSVNGRKFVQRAALGGQHNAQSQKHQAASLRLVVMCGLFPTSHDVGEKRRTWRALFIHGVL